MANYTQSTNFATKDSLPSGDPLKIVKGTEINTEFNNIAVAIATKADLLSPTITSPTLVTPALGTPTSGNLANTTGLPIIAGTTGTLSVARGGTGVTTSTGTGNVVLSNSPTLVTPALGTPASGVLTNVTGLPIDGGTTGTLPVARGGTGVTTSTGTGNNVLSASPTFTGTVVAPTPALSAAGTTVATVAAIQALYPVGSIYINAGVSTNPATLLGFGTWAAFGAGRVMVGLDGGDPLFDVLQETGGSKDATLVSHNHFGETGVNKTSHNHSFTIGRDFGATKPDGAGVGFGPHGFTNSNGFQDTLTTGFDLEGHRHDFTTSTSGSSATNANIQPYITVAMWRRTA